MKSFFISTIVLLSLFISSCTTLLHKPYTAVYLNTTPSNAHIVVDGIDTLPTQSPAIIMLKRSPYDQLVTVYNDTLLTNVVIHSKLSPLFLWGNIPTFPYGHIIDLTNNKRYTYPFDIKIDMANNYVLPATKRPFTDSLPSPTPVFTQTISIDQKAGFNVFNQQQNQPIMITAGIPYINFFNAEIPYYSDPVSGFWGISVGGEYYRSYISYFSAEAGLAVNQQASMPVYKNEQGLNVRMSAAYLNIRYNHRFHPLYFGYGFHYTYETWHKYNTYFTPSHVAKGTGSGLGLSLSAQANIWKDLFVGMLYQPEFNQNKEVYTNLFSFTLHWKYLYKDLADTNVDEQW